MIEIVPAIAALLITFSIGSNDTSNSFGLCIGCRVIDFKKATFLLLFFATLGIFLQGHSVMKTVGKDLVETNYEISTLALVISALIIVSSNFRGFPVSTHQVIVGSVAGAGLAYGMGVDLTVLNKIVLSWVLSPLAAGAISVVTFFTLEKVFRRLSFLELDRILKVLLLISAMLIAYNTGANELATAIAPVVHAGSLGFPLTAIFGVLMLWLGAFLLSHRVIETVCKGITPLDPKSGFSAHFGAGISVLVFTTLGMPISTTYCMIGGIASVGFAKSVRAVRIETLKRVILNFVTVPIIAFTATFSVSTLVLNFL
uniref:Inorganic phosphate transporter n=1 Tax=Archaeoglobus fulgidus TaxID=2234 RepID=A0A7C3MDN7_ARCFL